MPEDEKKTPGDPKDDGEKKPYSKPSVASEPIYETMALACTKLPGQGGICNAGAKRS